MSVWTHVAAVIRFDQVGNSEPPNLRKGGLPCGSEGALNYHLHTNPTWSSMARWVATIWGDLRDYEDVDEVLAYLRRVTDGQFVRQGVATVEVEAKQEQVFLFLGPCQEWEPAIIAAQEGQSARRALGSNALAEERLADKAAAGALQAPGKDHS